MEGTEKRIEKRHSFGLAEATRGLRGEPLDAVAPVWQRPSFSAPVDHHMVNPRHYSKHAIEPWDYVAANKLGYFEGSAIKYITRWRDKNGLTDLRKAIRFIEKLIEVEEKKAKPEG